MTDITYAISRKPLPWQEQGLRETTSGYGAKLTSPYVVRVDGDNRMRRVYITQWGNAGSAWFTYRGQRVHLPDTAESGDTVTATI